MRKRNTTIVARVLTASLAFASGSAMASKDYFVHTEPYNPSGLQQQPWSITVDALNGNALTPPYDACGMRFEGDSLLKWRSDEYGLVVEIPTDGNADVWLPRPGCGAWDVVIVESAGEQPYASPSDFAGYIEVDAKGYWINANGEKLIYVAQGCTPKPECNQDANPSFSHGWSDGLGHPYQQIRRAVEMLDSLSPKAFEQIGRATVASAEAAGQLEQHLVQRRRYHAGTLERPNRQLEDAASGDVAVARRALAECSAAFEDSRLAIAYRACNTALLKMQAARAALDSSLANTHR